VNPRVQRYLDKANECERMAAPAKNRVAASLAKDAMHWRALAKKAEDWERIHGLMTENLHQFRSKLLPPLN
jgi:hypothetical protein